MKLIFVFILPTTLFAQTKSIRLEEKPLPPFELKNNYVSKFLQSQPLYSNLPSQLKRFYFIVNYARLNPAQFYDSVISPILEIYPQFKGQYSESLKTDLLKTKELPLLALNQKLVQLANEHASDVVQNKQQPSHTASNGESFQERVKAAEIKTCAGENICVGQGDVIFSVFLLYLDYQLPGLGHRKALLSSSFVETGLGIDSYKNGQYFIVQDFACQQ